MIRAIIPMSISMSMEPPATGSVSVSFSIIRAVPELLTSECQPETAPHMMVTNMSGQRGLAPHMKPVYLGKSPKVGFPMRTPSAVAAMAKKTTQKPR